MHWMQRIISKIRYFGRVLSKCFKKVNLIFLLNPVVFSGQDFKKQKGPGTSDQLLFRLQNNFRNILLLLMYYIPDQVWRCNIKSFLSYSKNYICYFMQANSWHKLFYFRLSFWVWKVWKEREKKYKYMNILRAERAF